MIMSTRGQWIKPNWEFRRDWFSWHSARWWLFYRSKWVVFWVVAPWIPGQSGDCVCHLGFWWQEAGVWPADSATAWPPSQWASPEACTKSSLPSNLGGSQKNLCSPPCSSAFQLNIFGGKKMVSFLLVCFFVCNRRKISPSQVAVRIAWNVKLLKHGLGSGECRCPLLHHAFPSQGCRAPWHSWDLKV